MNREQRKKQLTRRLILFFAVVAALVWTLALVLFRRPARPAENVADLGVRAESTSSASSIDVEPTPTATPTPVPAATSTPTPTPTLTPTPTATPSPTPDPASDLTFTAEELSTLPWNLVLVNAEHPIPEDYEIPEITYFDDGQPITQGVDSRVYDALREMQAAANEAGYYPYVSSSFRDWDLQNYFFQGNVNDALAQGMTQEAAEAEAAKWVLPPGTSEHQIGLACDIVDPDYTDLDDGQLNTGTQQWLLEHCWEYGFILRYPSDKVDITGVSSEPWHYRYVGKEVAKEIYEQNLCLEEYLAQLLHG